MVEWDELASPTIAHRQFGLFLVGLHVFPQQELLSGGACAGTVRSVLTGCCWPPLDLRLRSVYRPSERQCNIEHPSRAVSARNSRGGTPRLGEIAALLL
jgi:hypothetical protein